MTEPKLKTGSVVITDPFVLSISGAQVGETFIAGSGAVVKLVRKTDNNV